MGIARVILLDTHVLVWTVADSRRLSRRAADAIRRNHREGGLAISAITLWELASLLARGRIQAYGTVDSSVRLLIDGVTVKAITPEIAALATQFPVFPRSSRPADWSDGPSRRRTIGDPRRKHPPKRAAEDNLVVERDRSQPGAHLLVLCQR